jgi:transposase-like protein
MKENIKGYESSLQKNEIGEVIREGARRMLQAAIETEVEVFLQEYSLLCNIEGRRHIVRNGYNPKRTIMTGAGNIPVSVPRVRDRREGISPGERIKYHSNLIPPYLRRTQDMDEFIPYLYLKGVSTGDFSDVLSMLLGTEISLSPATVVRLKEKWQEEYAAWNRRDLSGKRYVYWWVDGLYSNVRLEDDRTCILVIMGATETGGKELVSIDDGHRESEISWQNILLDLKKRGLTTGPALVTGDGSLGFWNAVSKEFPMTRHQRCWVHKTANILDKMPESIQAQAKRNIHEIYMADTRASAYAAFDRFVSLYEAKYPKAVECLLKSKEEGLAFYDFPAEHWKHIRTTNPIESTFATVRLRTYKTKGCGSRKETLTMVFKLVQSAEKRWQKIHSSKLILLVLSGEKFVDGILQYAA